jgi:hypothetical protein
MLRFKPLKDDHVIYFIHIPKTGGSSFNNLLVKIYRHRHLFHADDSVRLGKKSINELDTHKKSQIKVITSHARFDFAKSLLPDKEIIAITLIRDPIQRVKSQINYIYTTPKHTLHRQVKEIIDQNLDLSQLFKNNLNFNNLQCYMLSGESSAEKAISSVSKNIKLIGSTDRYNEFVQQCSSILGWQTKGLHLNEKVNKSLISLDLDESLILEYNQEDQRLFDWHKKN